MKKRAILFGMSNYFPSKSISADILSCTVNDVSILSKKLKQLQFDTSTFIDLKLKELKEKIITFAWAAPCDSLNIIYFSGHGGHSRGENYFYPVDFGISLDNGVSIENSALNIKSLALCFPRKVKLLIIIDACRKNLTSSDTCNFSEMLAPQNTYIAYATQFDDYSICTPQISYFTEALCNNILEPNISIDQLFTNVRAALYLKYSKQISNSVNGFMSNVSLNEQNLLDDVGKKVVKFVDQYGDMYIDKFGCFAGDDLVFIDAAQYCNISVLDAIYKFLKLDAERCGITSNLSESHEKLIAFWGMLGHGLEQDEFYTWQYRGRPVRLGEIPPLPLDMQKPMPDKGSEIEVNFTVDIGSDKIELQTNLPDNFILYGKINKKVQFNKVEVKDGMAIIPLLSFSEEVNSIDVYSVLPTVTEVDISIVGERCRNLIGKYVKFNPISGNTIEFHYEK